VLRSSPAFGEKGGDGFDVLLVPENLRRENFKFEISDGQGERSKTQEKERPENTHLSPTSRKVGHPKNPRLVRNSMGGPPAGSINIYYLGQTVPAHLQT
jgi:hypothetical protein